MTDFAPTSVILYVTDVEASTTFYRQALNKEPIETFDDFAVFALTEDVTIGLQTRDQIDPAATGTPGSVELSMSYATHDDVDQPLSDRLV
ncbi:VOC family protein [Propioniciclava sp.]|uniref:VOC family protein n=1 Tax=Propioniciclava sp. TaxID=2038686 RepID=UPI00262851F2|nr:VOC family protein [Propioniciclava sp.]